MKLKKKLYKRIKKKIAIKKIKIKIEIKNNLEENYNFFYWRVKLKKINLTKEPKEKKQLKEWGSN